MGPQILVKFANTKFNQDPLRGVRVFPCSQTHEPHGYKLAWKVIRINHTFIDQLGNNLGLALYFKNKTRDIIF
jgi:hypothetical protein